MDQPAMSIDEIFEGLDRSGPLPLYAKISQRLRSAIERGALPAGARLENEVALAARLGVSRPTIRQAIQDLVDRGLLVRRRGVGTQVVGGRLGRSLELSSLHDDLERSGRRSTTELLTHEVVGADAATAESVGVAAGTAVLHLRRLRRSDGVPLAILDNILPPVLADLESASLERGGLYAALRGRGVTMRVARQSIGARAATAEEAALLGLVEGAPVLTMQRVVFDDAGDVIELGRHCYSPVGYEFELTLVER